MTRHESPAPVTSEAVVHTERPVRYGKQLVNHLGRKATAKWDDEAARGSVVFAGRGRAKIVAEDVALRLRLKTTTDTVEQLEGALGRHLVRFGARDELVVRWKRSDGTAGTEQRNEEA